MLVTAVAGTLGAFVGSFLNVCIHRLPRNESVVQPPSRCYACGTRVAWYDNLPLVSYLMLRGRCRWCGAPFSPRYLVLEVLCALLTGAVAWAVMEGGIPHLAAVPWWPGQMAGRALATAALLALLWYVLVSAVIDLEHTIIPDELTKPMQAVGPFLAVAAGTVLDLGWHPLAWMIPDGRLDPAAFLAPFLAWAGAGIVLLVLSLPVARWIYTRFTAEAPWSAADHRGFRVGVLWFAAVSAVQTAVAAGLLAIGGGSWWMLAGLLLGSAVLGSLAGWWSLYLVGLLGTAAFKRNAMGFGDVKFLAPLGAMLGPVGVLYAFLVAAVVGSLVGLPLRLMGRREVPFGPYLAVGVLVVLAGGPSLHAWFWGRFPL